MFRTIGIVDWRYCEGGAYQAIEHFATGDGAADRDERGGRVGRAVLLIKTPAQTFARAAMVAAGGDAFVCLWQSYYGRIAAGISHESVTARWPASVFD
jgi:hypothetical protein